MTIEEKTEEEKGLEGTRLVETPTGTTLAIQQEINYTPDNKKVGNTKPEDISPYAVPRRQPGGEYKV